MVKLLFFRFWVINLRLQNKQFHFELLTQWVNFYFSLSSYKREVDKWKKSFKYYSSNVGKRLEIDNTPSISKNLL